MTDQEVRDFLAQFDRARESFDQWPKWMQDAAAERAATFPKPPADAEPAYCPVCGPRELGHRKDCPYGVPLIDGNTK